MLSVFYWDSLQLLRGDTVGRGFTHWFSKVLDYLPRYDGGPRYIAHLRGEMSSLGIVCLKDYG